MSLCEVGRVGVNWRNGGMGELIRVYVRYSRDIAPISFRLRKLFSSGPPHSCVFMPKRLVKKLRGRKMTVNVVKIITERFWELASSACRRDQRTSSTWAWRWIMPCSFSN